MGRAKNDDASRSIFDMDKNLLEVGWNIIVTKQTKELSYCH